MYPIWSHKILQCYISKSSCCPVNRPGLCLSAAQHPERTFYRSAEWTSRKTAFRTLSEGQYLTFTTGPGLREETVTLNYCVFLDNYCLIKPPADINWWKKTIFSQDSDSPSLLSSMSNVFPFLLCTTNQSTPDAQY